MRQNGEIAILLRPTKVVFSHKKEGETAEELRTVVAYQNPFTGDYCVHKSRAGPKGYVNNLQHPDSPDSGLSDEYEPLNLEPAGPQPSLPHVLQDKPPGFVSMPQPDHTIKLQMPESPSTEYNSVNKTWNWNYKEYQI
ncbi:hypothetical protein PYW08_008484 [Mythimna loreyi]|uniref:Uncharacterized protein n=1 Tax=Mythimna loreyi TaxID=667449 RepID=A0ACC2QE24_9NEOP|nr:hypothetical protein PYW08_008484 [Mythimna loreyi]